MGRIIDELTMIYDEWDWERKNRHNFTTPANSFVRSCVEVGNNTYGKLFVVTSNTTTKLHIGAFCSIGPNVTFVVSGTQPTDVLSTYPFKTYILHEANEGMKVKDMYIDDDAWIGANAIILPGVHVGQGAVIGAGAVVTKDVEPYAIVAGMPARTIRRRFSDEIIHELIKLDFKQLTPQQIKEHAAEFYEPLNENMNLDWFPEKNNYERITN